LLRRDGAPDSHRRGCGPPRVAKRLRPTRDAGPLCPRISHGRNRMQELLELDLAAFGIATVEVVDLVSRVLSGLACRGVAQSGVHPVDFLARLIEERDQPVEIGLRLLMEADEHIPVPKDGNTRLLEVLRPGLWGACLWAAWLPCGAAGENGRQSGAVLLSGFAEQNGRWGPRRSRGWGGRLLEPDAHADSFRVERSHLVELRGPEEDDSGHERSVPRHALSAEALRGIVRALGLHCSRQRRGGTRRWRARSSVAG
jgi:hypothetical protein